MDPCDIQEAYSHIILMQTVLERTVPRASRRPSQSAWILFGIGYCFISVYRRITCDLLQLPDRSEDLFGACSRKSSPDFGQRGRMNWF